MSLSSIYTVGVNITGNTVGLARAAQTARRDMQGLNKTMLADAQKMAKTRELLGVRSEREVQREIQRTQAAYSRLARSGTMSWGEQRRAARAMREEVRSLNNEMGRFTAGQRALQGLHTGGMLVAGGAAATAVMAPKVRESMAYDLRLAHLSNTAFAGQSLDARRAGRRSIDAAVIDAVRSGGGTRERALDTYNELSASGAFTPSEIKQILRDAVLAGTANDADPAAFAHIAIKARKTLGIGAGGMNRLFGMGTYAGQAGGFEIRDMAKWLPEQMAAASAVGMRGEAGFAKLVALNQAAINTSGSPDQAGNNVVNLLAKLSSEEMANNLKKMGIDLPGRIASGRMQGMDALDVLGGLLDEQLGKSKNYQNVRAQLATAKDGSERQQALRSVGDIAQGTVFGKALQDRQALMALIAFMNDRKRVSDIAAGAMANPDAHLSNMQLIRETASFKTEQLGQEKAIALHSAIGELTPAVGGLAEKVTVLMREYPDYTKAIVGASFALTGLATAAAAAGLAGGVLGAGGKAAAGAALSGMAARAMSVVGGAARVGGVAGAGYFAGSQLWDLGSALGDLHNAQNREGVVLSPESRARLGVGHASGEELVKAIKRSEFKGEVKVHITTAPGVGADASVMYSNPRIPFKADVGRTGLAAGY